MLIFRECDSKEAESEKKKAEFDELDKKDRKFKMDIDHKKTKKSHAAKSLATEEKKVNYNKTVGHFFCKGFFPHKKRKSRVSA